MSAVYKDKAELEDIVNEGIIALMDCIDRYDPSKGVQFDSFASIRVRGSIIDYLRKQDWVPRDVRKKSIVIGNAYLALKSAKENPPTDEDVAAYLGMDMEELLKITAQSHRFILYSYEELLSDNLTSVREPASELEAPGQNLEEEELKEVIAGSIENLSEKERLVVTLYYYEELKLKEIAAVLGLTASGCPSCTPKRF
jgi:RNA polymerase sigma factor for flagellar operon FliA